MKKYQNLKNMARILHHVSEMYFNRPLPRWIAKKIAKRNRKDYQKCNDGRLILETYDGSNQIVHPDFIVWQDKILLVCTPHPYGYNKCENPSVYIGDSVQTLAPACKNPIDFPSSKAKGSILCDPCFFENGNRLAICYRERIQKKSEVIYQLHVQDSRDGSVWENKQMLVSKTDDPLISPAVLSWDGKKYLYHVCAKGLGGDIVVSDLSDDMHISNSNALRCVGLPENLWIWHIGLHSDTYTKTVASSGYAKALLMLRNQNEAYIYKAHQDSPQGDFVIDEKVSISKAALQNIKMVYKSAYTPDGRIALSFFDLKNRLGITVIEDL